LISKEKSRNSGSETFLVLFARIKASRPTYFGADRPVEIETIELAHFYYGARPFLLSSESIFAMEQGHFGVGCHKNFCFEILKNFFWLPSC